MTLQLMGEGRVAVGLSVLFAPLDEIAQALFVTARTVEGRLTHVVQKLDVKGRPDLADWLHAREAAP
jgi:DNA-binding CsgD family transcriptional regulator